MVVISSFGYPFALRLAPFPKSLGPRLLIKSLKHIPGSARITARWLTPAQDGFKALGSPCYNCIKSLPRSPASSYVNLSLSAVWSCPQTLYTYDALRASHTGPRCIMDCCSCDQSVPLLHRPPPHAFARSESHIVRPETLFADYTSARPETPFAEYLRHLRPATPFTDLAAEDEPNTSVGYLAPTTRKERWQGWSGTPFSGRAHWQPLDDAMPVKSDGTYYAQLLLSHITCPAACANNGTASFFQTTIIPKSFPTFPAPRGLRGCPKCPSTSDESCRVTERQRSTVVPRSPFNKGQIEGYS
ncbi:hypothetical protein C8R47DRAFT_1072725 [Mycena vitilis]|nr:hypothetical protein C8R47DRAFT_1072725 [Mycena vitilis]